MQPSFETIKQELTRLHSYTSEIGKAQEVTAQVQKAAIAVIEATQSIEKSHSQLLEELQDEYLRNTNEQTATLRKTAQQQAAATQELLTKELGTLRQGAEKTVKALQRVVDEQPQILSSIQAHHAQGINTQTDLLRKTINESTNKLNEQFSSQMDQLEKVKQDFNTSVGKQLDGLTAITDRLQVISASLTAFRDAMNAARFTDRLESIENQQANILKRIDEGQNYTQNKIQSFTDILDQRTEKIANKIRSSNKMNLAIQIATIAAVAISIAITLFK